MLFESVFIYKVLKLLYLYFVSKMLLFLYFMTQIVPDIKVRP
jgi:hypothetical protein